MTQVLSPLFKVEIVPPGSVLQNAAAALPANAWGSITIGNQLNEDPSAVGNAMMSYSYRMSRDPITKGLHFYGGCHGIQATAQKLFVGLYAENSNVWNPTTPLSIPNGVSSNPCHAFWAGTTNTTNGHFYCINPYIDDLVVHRYRPPAGTFDAPFPVRPGPTRTCAVLEYHPNLYGGQGGLVFGNDTGIWTLNVNAASPSWTIILDRTNQVDAMRSLGFGVGCYSTKDDCVYMGAGTSGFNLWCVTAAGAVSQISAAPVTLGIWDASNNVAGIYNSGNPANGFVAITRDGAVYTYNKQTNSWSQVSTTLPPALMAAPNNERAFGCIPEYGCLAAISSANSSDPIFTSTTMHIWKH